MKLIKKKNGDKEQFNIGKIKKFLEIKSKNLKYINVDEIISELNGQLYDGINTLELQKVLLMVSKSKIQEEPDYSYLAARILLDSIYKEALGSKNFNDELYREKFISNIKELVNAGRLTDKVLTVDLKRLANFIKPERDLLFKYHGLQIVYDRYLLHIENKRMETPQQFFMRVAIGISLGEKNVEEWAERFYEEFSQFNYLPSSPTLFNSCTLHPQLSSCYLSTFDDSIDGIFGGIHQQALLSKWAGGLGMSVSSIRAIGAWIKGTNGPSQGLIPWLKCINDMLLAVNQGSKRKGSGVVYLEPWHLEIESFLDLRKSTGDDRLRCHDTHTALWCPDLFFNKIEEDDDWYFFSPDETPELPETYGKEFEDLYHSYVKKAEAGELRQFKKMKAKALWKKILVALKETGHPWICFKDTSNERYNDMHEGIIHSANLCVEIFRHTKPTKTYKQEIKELGEVAVCNLASVNLKNFVKGKEICWNDLAKVVRVAIRGLDNVIDVNYYPVKEAANSNLKHRPIGLGQMGFHDMLHELGIDYSSDAAIELSDAINEFISFHALDETYCLGQEKGVYTTFQGSLLSKGMIPKYTFSKKGELETEKTSRSSYSQISLEQWHQLSNNVKNGVRNSNVMAIAPTATISYISGCSQSIEPDYSVLFSYSTLSGDFIMINEYFIDQCKEAGVWNKELLEQVKINNGNISSLKNIPKKIREQFRTAMDMDQKHLIKCASARQKWIDMGQSLNIYYNKSSMKELSDIYLYAWKNGLKSTYYLRTEGASKSEKTSVAVEKTKTCKVGEPCESCQ